MDSELSKEIGVWILTTAPSFQHQNVLGIEEDDPVDQVGQVYKALKQHWNEFQFEVIMYPSVTKISFQRELTQPHPVPVTLTM